MREKQIECLVNMVLNTLEERKLISYEVPREDLIKKGCSLIRTDFDQEKRLDEEVYLLMDQLEQTQSFERHKMFPMLKRKLAEKKGFIL